MGIVGPFERVLRLLEIAELTSKPKVKILPTMLEARTFLSAEAKGENG